MILYNTKTRKKEKLKPLGADTVRVYSCGPTVYFSAHIGNMRAYIFTDILKKALELDGLKVLDVMNITDVGHLTTDADTGEDKMEQSAKAQGVNPSAIAKKYTDEYMQDCNKLNIRKPQIVAPATKYVKEMIDFVKALEKKGMTYQTSDGVYFDASKFADYSKLSGASIEGNRGGARIDLGEKRNINDFALWKFCGDNVIQKWPALWKSPSGSNMGCPGWHIECSAIALKHLGETFDIHTGGIDHIPIHHTNEIAQTESLTGKPMCQFFCHNEFMTVNGGKMSKSLGNAYTLTQLEERGFSPVVFRYFVLLASYRSILNFTFEALTAAQNAYNNLIPGLIKHRDASDENKASKTILDNYWQEFKNAVTDDLNTPKAIAVIWNALKEKPSKQIYDLIIKMDKTLSLDFAKAVDEQTKQTSSVKIPSEVTTLAESRIKAKQQKDWVAADKLRASIGELGWEVTDTKDGYVLNKKKG